LRRAARIALALAFVAGGVHGEQLSAPNVVQVSPRLVTSGQPAAEELAKLKDLGFGAVVYLAPPTVSDAVKAEPMILERQGIAFVNIPIRFDAPSDADFDAFAATMRGFGDRKVLVHCQINLRASSMVFLYRAIVLEEDPRLAYEAVEKVWVPDRAWRPFIERTLRRHGIDFELI
jgi:protein tyrosine phosphatase (PTP) superfamily phosphohydrolase (DUF442 family)